MRWAHRQPQYMTVASWPSRHAATVEDIWARPSIPGKMDSVNVSSCPCVFDNSTKPLIRKQARHVLYWSQMNRRVESNHALAYAAWMANDLDVPLPFYEGLTCAYPYASDARIPLSSQECPKHAAPCGTRPRSKSLRVNARAIRRWLIAEFLEDLSSGASWHSISRVFAGPAPRSITRGPGRLRR